LASSTPLQNEISHMFPRSRERSERIPSALDYLKGMGYYTSVISEFAGDIFSRIDIGFDNILAPDMNFNVIVKQVILEKQVFLLPYLLNSTGRYIFPEIRDIAKFSDPGMLTNETIDQIKIARGKPFFISVFYSITHFPFAASYPYYNEYAKKDYKGAYKYFKQVQIKIGNENDKAAGEPAGIDTQRDREQINALYDGCLKEFDHEIGRILSYLEKSGLMKNTIVVITADHGENLYEYEYGLGHGEHLKGDFALEVPFIIIADNLLSEHRGKSIEKRSSIIDIMPTIFDLAEIEKPNFFRGASLFNTGKRQVDAYCETGIWFDNNKSSDLFFYHNRIDYPDISGLLEVDFNYRREGVIKQDFQNIIAGSKYRAIYSNDYKLIYIPLKSGVKFELYNIKTDKENRHNLADKDTEALKTMKKKFYDYIERESFGNMIKVGDYVLPIFSYPVF
jgi:arylsulfatase A-like enzyme